MWISGRPLCLVGWMETRWNTYLPFPFLLSLALNSSSSPHGELFPFLWLGSRISHFNLLEIVSHIFCLFVCFLLLQAFKEMLYSAQDQAPSIEGKYSNSPLISLIFFCSIRQIFWKISNTNRKTLWESEGFGWKPFKLDLEPLSKGLGCMCSVQTGRKNKQFDTRAWFSSEI